MDHSLPNARCNCTGTEMSLRSDSIYSDLEGGSSEYIRKDGIGDG